MKTRLLHIILMFGMALAASGFDKSVYRPASVLSEGTWVKIAVKESGMHFIPASALRSWGFSDPSKVTIHGYGGRRMADRLTEATYIDDLPVVPCEAVGGGLAFYAAGPDTWTRLREPDMWERTLNPYTNYGYYFLTDSRPSDTASVPAENPTDENATDAATTFVERLAHELDQVSPGEAGHMLVGEDFRFTPSRTFTFQMPGRVEGSDVWMQCNFFGKMISPGSLTFKANGQAVSPDSPTSRIKPAPETYGDTALVRRRFVPKGETLALAIAFSCAGTVHSAHLDRLCLTYLRSLSLPAAGTLHFASTSRKMLLAGASADVRVWDVTDAGQPRAMGLKAEGSSALWANPFSGLREYAVWRPGASMPCPELVGKVKNQNIHSEPTPDMIIVTPAGLMSQSRRVADLHEKGSDKLKVLVLTDEQIYNEFGSGMADVGALRRMFKMFYDRGVSEEGRALRYALLMGGAHHDHRRLTSSAASSRIMTLPIWQTDLGLAEGAAYPTDDFVAFLEDGSGTSMTNDLMSIAVGRIPARTESAAKVYVDRLVAYVNNAAQGEWRNSFILMADDEDSGTHMEQADAMEKCIRDLGDGAQGLTFHKVYFDAYEYVGGVAVGARKKLMKLLDDGVLWWTYIGHGNSSSMSGEGLMTPTDIGNLYLRRAPFLYAATCLFARIDGSETSGFERLMLDDAGGIIGGLCPSRSVYIARNGHFSNRVATEAFRREADGRIPPVGEMARRAKNNLPADDNKRRYLLLADPALRLAAPAMRTVLKSVDGVEDSPEVDLVLKAQGRPVLRGEVLNPDGSLATDFSGWVSVSLFDAERSYVTLGHGKYGKNHTVDEQGERLYMGRGAVKDGVFEITVPIPSQIADNFRHATLSFFAASDSGVEAAGVDRSVYVCGVDENAVADVTAPVIEYMYLNHQSFKPHDTVNSSPMLIARVSDDLGLNMSNYGVGRQMSLKLDADGSYTDLASYFTPDNDGAPAGVIRYPLSGLADGAHTATLRVWDNGDNVGSATIEFFVDGSQAPKVFDVWSDANPAVTEANFYVEHNRPDARLTVTIDIYALDGTPIWSQTTSGRADMYLSAPVTWPLTNSSGQRVGRGIYVYRTTVTDENGVFATSSKRIAVSQ